MHSIFPKIRVFFSESALCIRWPKFWNFSNHPSNEYSWLIYFSFDWFGLLSVQGTNLDSVLKSRDISLPTNKQLFFLFSQSILFSSSVMSESLWPHGLQHARLPCPSPTPGVCSNSCPLSWWCHPLAMSVINTYPVICPRVQMTSILY